MRRNAPTLTQVLQDFYQAYLPSPSPFELPEGQRNPFLYLQSKAPPPPRTPHPVSFLGISLVITVIMVLLGVRERRLAAARRLP
jgi:hypothetical protein